MTELELLGLNDAESKIYRALMVSGQLTKGELRIATELDKSTADTSIDNLLNKNLVREVPGLQGRYAALLPVGNLKNEIEASITLIDKLAEELKLEKSTVINKLKEKLEHSTKEFDTLLDEKMMEIHNEFSEFDNYIEETHNQVEKSLKNVDETNNSAVREKIGETTKKVTETLSSQKSQSLDTIGVHRDALEAQKIESTEKVNQVKENNKSNLQKPDISSLESVKGEFNSQVENWADESKTQIAEVEGKFNADLDILQEKSNEALTKLEGVVQEFTPIIKDISGEVVQELSTIAEGEQGHIDTMKSLFNNQYRNMEGTITSLQEKKEENHTAVMEQLQSLTEQSAGIHDEIKSTIDSGLDEEVQEMSSLLSESDEAIQTHLSDLRTGIESSMDESISGFNQTIANEMSKVKGQIDELSQQILGIAEKLKEVNELSKSTLDSHKTQIEEQLTGLKNSLVQDIESKNTDLNTTRTGKIDELKNKFSEKSISLKSKFSEELETISLKEKEISTAVNQNLSKHDEEFKATLADSLSNINELQLSLNEKTTELINSINEFKDSKSVEFRGKFDDFETSIKDNLSAKLRELNSIISGIKTEVAQQVKGHSTEISAGIDSLSQKVSSTIETQIAGINTQIDELHNESVLKMNEMIDDLGEIFSNLIESNYSENNEQVTRMEKDINDIEINLRKILSESLNEAGEILLGSLSTISTNLNEFVKSTLSKVDDNKTKVESIGDDAIQKAEEVFKQGGGSQIDVVQESFDLYNNKFTEVTSKVSDPTQKLVKILAGLEGEIESTDTPLSKTTHVVGKEAIFEYISDMISRIKSKATILVPSIEMLDVDAILALKRTSQVTIISKLDGVQQDWIDKMHGATPNITLRSIMIPTGVAQLPDFIGCEREGEEILLGTIDEGAKDWVAIASGSEYFVKILGNIVIADYARGKSRQLPK
ncbi:MAG: hypothetical protein INQ03_01585 [Candidatus Heimdallarchaeota archaeon]|nr:hypothetical protein [Candidatus Heimdallarchaeota archaeon]